MSCKETFMIVQNIDAEKKSKRITTITYNVDTLYIQSTILA